MVYESIRGLWIWSFKLLNVPFEPVGDERLGGEATPQKIRKAYRRLAIRYHPDKNPSQEAAERFNEITKAYDLLSAARRGSPGPDAINVLLIVKVQSMLFRRFPEDLKPYKYAGYPYLLSALRVEGGTSITPEHFVLLEAGTTLVFYTCLCSHLNATELLRESGGHVLAELLSRCVSIVSEYTEPWLVYRSDPVGLQPRL